MNSSEAVHLLVELASRLKCRGEIDSSNYFLNLSREEPSSIEFIERASGIGRMLDFFDFTKEEKEIMLRIQHLAQPS